MQNLLSGGYFSDLVSNDAGKVVLLLILVWTLVWKGMALWKSARLGSRNWFIALLVINTVGILEILYIYYFSKKRK